MTDFAQSNVDAWQAHERLAPFRDRGRLDFALFDLERDDELRLRRAGVTLGAARCGNPMVVLANYAFDSTAQDAFQVRHGVLYERLARVLSTRQERDLSDPDAPAARPGPLRPVAGRRRRAIEDPRLLALLERYRREYAEASFLLPVGAFRCVRALEALTGGRLLLLTGDKARDARRRAGPRPGSRASTSTAGGCFSFLVNLHALGRYFEEGGRQRAAGGPRATSGSRSAALLSAAPGVASDETRLAFRQSLDDFGPADYHALVFGLREQNATLPLQVDPRADPPGRMGLRARVLVAEPILKLAAKAPAWQQADLADALSMCGTSTTHPARPGLRAVAHLRGPQAARAGPALLPRVAAHARAALPHLPLDRLRLRPARPRHGGDRVDRTLARAASRTTRPPPPCATACRHARATDRPPREGTGGTGTKAAAPGSMMSGRRSRPCPSEARWSSKAGPAC